MIVGIFNPKTSIITSSSSDSSLVTVLSGSFSGSGVATRSATTSGSSFAGSVLTGSSVTGSGSGSTLSASI